MTEWIKFEDEFPSEELKEVLTFEIISHVDDGRKIPIICLEEVASIHEDEETGAFYSDGGGYELTHWMPLPETPN